MGFGDIVTLLEHLPRVGNLLTRVVPMLENYVPASLNTGAPDIAARNALEDFRADLNHSAESHASLALEVRKRGEQLALVLAELQTLRLTVEASTTHIEAIEKQLKLHRLLLVVAAVAALFASVVLIVRF